MDKTESFQTCCGKVICNGCIYEMIMSEGKDLCAFCRTPPARDDTEDTKRVKKQMDKGNALAFVALGSCYTSGTHGLPQDHQKAHELFLKSGELGCAGAYYTLGQKFRVGESVEKDVRKAKHYFELAAVMGSLDARYNLGVEDYNAGNHQRAMKHFIISSKAGHETALEGVKKGFLKGLVTKDEYASTLRAYQKIQDEMKSDAREKAAASDSFREMLG